MAVGLKLVHRDFEEAELASPWIAVDPEAGPPFRQLFPITACFGRRRILHTIAHRPPAMSLLPANLAVQLMEGSLPWDRSTQLHIDTFLRLYTLHDSYWIGMHANCGWDDAAIAVIRFDPVWNSSVSFPTSLVADWPLLFLRFSCVNTIRLSGFRDNGGGQWEFQAQRLSTFQMKKPSPSLAITMVES